MVDISFVGLELLVGCVHQSSPQPVEGEMANVKGPKDHSPAIEKLAGQKLQDPKATKAEKRLAGAILAHADGKPAPKTAAKPAAKPPSKAAPKAAKPAPRPAPKKK
ncbi:hypothetical protein [Rhizobium gallicum]|uniref:hypothetical protein n=1 Tax=Rhizobium gallicum TaxID=56730 RepID=UPI001EF7DA1F|nr:hypothetical protein [Rhizobium gallicum]ULJ73605.1 hypothetical protein L2W42_08540 [Rhizobium gallicum]